MVLTKSELISSFQDEVRILLHLTTKVDRSQLDYRPTPKQRSTLELVRYLSMMGPTLVAAGKAGKFDPATWAANEQAANARDFDQAVAAIAGQTDAYPALLADLSDAELRAQVQIFGPPQSRGSFFINGVLAGFAAYRTQLFCYMKACGREELNTRNLWAGMDPAPPSVS